MFRAWILLAAVTPVLLAQDPVFRAGTTLATVGFHVVRGKAYVPDLKPEDVILLEDGQPRSIAFFEGGLNKIRTTTIDIALLFDISGSVTEEGLLDTGLWKSTIMNSLPGASLAVYGFDARLRRFCLPTRDPNLLAAAFNSLLKTSRKDAQVQPELIPISLPPKRKSNQGGTWIYESVIGAVHDMAAWPDKSTRLIIVFSDGFNTTTSLPEDAAGAAREAGIAVYPVALGHWKLVEKIRAADQQANADPARPNVGAQQRSSNLHSQEREILDFASMGELTGGRSFDPFTVNSDSLRRIAGAMVSLVLSEYVVGFNPDPPGDKPTKHKLAVKLASKELGKITGGTRTIVH
jgi:VWFA-related protein